MLSLAKDSGIFGQRAYNYTRNNYDKLIVGWQKALCANTDIYTLQQVEYQNLPSNLCDSAMLKYKRFSNCTVHTLLNSNVKEAKKIAKEMLPHAET